MHYCVYVCVFPLHIDSDRELTQISFSPGDRSGEVMVLLIISSNHQTPKLAQMGKIAARYIDLRVKRLAV